MKDQEQKEGRAPAVSVQHTTIRYGKTVAVKDIGLTISKGQCFGLLGPNGAGKTSTMHAIAGIVRPAAGTVMLGPGETIGIAPQEIALYPSISARENLRFFGSLCKLRGPTLAKRIDDVLNLVGLMDHADTRVYRYSGGMMRRLNFAAAILHAPSILLLDEPTAGVDPQSRALLLDYISEYRVLGGTIIYSTHYMEEVERICDAVAIIDHGQVIASGSVSELIRAARKPVLQAHVAGGPSDAVVSQIGGRRISSPGVIAIEVESVVDGLREVLAWSVKNGLALMDVKIVEGSLESVFLDLTGRMLRDEAEVS